MKEKVKGSIYAALVVLMVACFLNGCKGTDEIPPVSSVGETTVEAGKQTETVASQSSNGNTAGRIEPPYLDEMIEALDEEECPEGYVYDYQVSMEPIPEEIAALGGPCQGTIHAFPSKIGMALTELEMEKDPVLKAEVEKRIPEIEAALEEEIGGDFSVEGVILRNDLGWVFFCTENRTGYQFDLYYANNEYYAQKYETLVIPNVISTNDYYKEQESITVRNDLIPIIEEIFHDGDKAILFKSDVKDIDIVIAQYVSSVDKREEQKNIVRLWDALNTYNSEVDYQLCITYYPVEYRQVIQEKMSGTINFDYNGLVKEEIIKCLGKNGEILGAFNYFEYDAEEYSINLDTLLQQYQSDNYNEEIIWEYWVQ